MTPYDRTNVKTMLVLTIALSALSYCDMLAPSCRLYSGHCVYILQAVCRLNPGDVSGLKRGKTSPQCRNAFLLSPDVSEFEFQCRDDVSG